MAMKLLAGTAILCMLATAPVYARQSQDDKQQEAPKAPDRSDKTANKPAKEPANKPPEKPVDKPSKPPKEAPVKTESAPRHQQDQQAQEQQKTQEKAQQNQEKEQQKQAKNQQKQAERQAKNQKQDQNRNQGHAETADNGPRGNEGGRRIPEDRYRSDFGRAHTFHVRHDNDDRFQFGGFWFQYTDAWPSDWDYNDDFYIVEIDGEDYLCDARFPDQRIVVVIAG